jgi:hypothetical protein
LRTRDKYDESSPKQKLIIIRYRARTQQPPYNIN